MKQHKHIFAWAVLAVGLVDMALFAFLLVSERLTQLTIAASVVRLELMVALPLLFIGGLFDGRWQMFHQDSATRRRVDDVSSTT